MTHAARHPAMRADVAKAASAVAASVDGSGPFWDALATTMRPDEEFDGTHCARDVILDIRRNMPGILPRGRCRGDARRTAIARWAERRAIAKRSEMTTIPLDEDGRIQVQRLIACELESMRPEVGIFWTSDLYHGGLLDAPWRKGGSPTIVLTAGVDPDHVDWTISCMARMDLESGEYEKEIRLVPGAPLHDLHAGTWDQTLDPARSRRIDLPDLQWTS